MTILRSKLTVTASSLGATSGRSKAAVDDLATLTFSANSAGGVQITSVAITFSGSAPSQTAFYSGTGSNAVVRIYDAANGTYYVPVASSSVSTTGGKISFNLNNYQLSAGSSKSFTLRLNTTLGGSTAIGVTGISQTLSATIAATTDVAWQDALDSAASTLLPVESYLLPINIASVSYAQGT